MASRSVPTSPIASLPNLRDLGGWPTTDDHYVRTGVLFRSTDFHSFATADLTGFEELGIRAIYDFRAEDERRAQPDPDLPNVVNIGIDVLGDVTGTVAAGLDDLLADPATATRAMHTVSMRDAENVYLEGYRHLVSSTAALTGYRTFYRGLLDRAAWPTLFHCATGKDRTGWAAASFLMLMGVDRADVYRDYLLTNDRLLPELQPLFDDFTRAGGDPSALRVVLGVDAGYLTAAITEMETRFGGIHGYFTDGLQIGPSEQQVLRNVGRVRQ